MPYNRPTLTELRERNQAFFETALGDVGALLRFSNMRIMAHADAGMAWLHYGYLDWIAKQAVPSTATDEYLAAWGALKSIYRKSATAANCAAATFTGNSGATVDANALLNRSDGYQYILDESITIGNNGTATGSITAVLLDASENSTGGGDDGNADSGTTLSLDSAWEGVDSTVTMIDAAAGGVDIEDEDSFRSRVLQAYQSTPQGGSNSDYVKWALAVSGVTRAWPYPRLFGAGTVGVYIMCDGETTDNSGLPDGTDGVATDEDYAMDKATGMQLTVADYIYPLRPVTALVYICAPIQESVDIVIDGISDADSDTVQKIYDAIDSVMYDSADPTDGILYLSDLVIAISDVSGTDGFLITSPSANIRFGTGKIPVRGTVLFT
ncbi:baseplate J/gp47 family protein [Brenneria populi subsp. brevivirga]|uniref:baseplate J/gp47 family protein n=1 Tax=Brenneria populi TaxID=1505588 RepID=UPI002E1739AB|nr:baseplate J/gp47 family protein [Brenneria populi subsp. brevivirga]